MYKFYQTNFQNNDFVHKNDFGKLFHQGGFYLVTLYMSFHYALIPPMFTHIATHIPEKLISISLRMHPSLISTFRQISFFNFCICIKSDIDYTNTNYFSDFCDLLILQQKEWRVSSLTHPSTDIAHLLIGSKI